MFFREAEYFNKYCIYFDSLYICNVDILKIIILVFFLNIILQTFVFPL